MNRKRSKRLAINDSLMEDTSHICSNEWTTFPKDSFKRFGEDLSELILSYFSLEDKFRFECVSKQFQRLVFNKQTELVFDYKLKKRLEKTDLFGQPYVEVNTMSLILKKCSNIKRLSVLANFTAMDRFISLITTNCDNLNSIELHFNKMSENGLKEFCDKFGQQMKSIEFVGRMTSCKALLKSCPNVETLDMIPLSRQLSIVFSSRISKPFFQKLKSFSFTYYTKDTKNIVRLVEHNKKTLKAIKVKITSSITSESFAVLCNQLSELSKLNSICLIFEKNSITDFKLIFANLKRIANNFPDIKKVSILFSQLISPFIEHIFGFINIFKRIKRLFLHSYDYWSPVPQSAHLLEPKGLLDCKLLAHLYIHSNDVKFTDQFFESIVKCCPKLQSIEGNGYITNNGLKSLSKLSDLKNIVLNSDEIVFDVNKQFLRDLVIDCKKMQNICLQNNSRKLYISGLVIHQLRQTNGLELVEIEGIPN